MPTITEWAQSKWFFGHSMAAVIMEGDPNDETLDTDNTILPTPKDFCKYIRAMVRVLPCPNCRIHAIAYVKSHPPENVVKDSETAQRYMYDFHDYVNKTKEHPTVSPSFEEVKLAFNPTRPWKRFGGWRILDSTIDLDTIKIDSSVKPSTDTTSTTTTNTTNQSSTWNVIKWVLIVIAMIVLIVIIGYIIYNMVKSHKQQREAERKSMEEIQLKGKQSKHHYRMAHNMDHE